MTIQMINDVSRGEGAAGASAADGATSADRKSWVGCTISMINGVLGQVKQFGPCRLAITRCFSKVCRQRRGPAARPLRPAGVVTYSKKTAKKRGPSPRISERPRTNCQPSWARFVVSYSASRRQMVLRLEVFRVLSARVFSAGLQV